MKAARDPAFQQYLSQTRDEPVYVILGVQGSGTNLLGRILRRFYNFSLLRDRSMVFNAAAALGPAPTPAAVRREIQQFTRKAFPSALRRKAGKVIGDYTAFPGVTAELLPETVTNGAEFARMIYAYRAYSLGTTRMAIKSDDLWESIDAIDEVLPKRRIILVTRDFRDNLLSVGGKAFGPIEPIRAAEYVKKRLHPYAEEYRRAGRAGFHVKFETLVTSPQRFFEDFTKHFGIPSTVDPEVAARQLRIRPNKTQKWKRLPASELAWCEGILRDELLAFGYTPETPAPVLPANSTVIAATARDVVKRVPQKVRRILNRIRT